MFISVILAETWWSDFAPPEETGLNLAISDENRGVASKKNDMGSTSMYTNTRVFIYR